MFHRTLAAFALLAFAATPVLAAEDCAQAIKDTTAKFKASTIGPQVSALVGDRIAEAELLYAGSTTRRLYSFSV